MLTMAAAALLVFLALGISALRDLDALERRFALLDRERVLRRTRLKILITVAIAGGTAVGAGLAAALDAAYGEHKSGRLTQELSAAEHGLFRLEQELAVTRTPAPPAAAAAATGQAPAAVAPSAETAKIESVKPESVKLEPASDHRVTVRSSGEVKVRKVPNGPVMASVYAGAVVYLVAGAPAPLRGDNIWRQVRLPDGRLGWVAERFLDLPATPAADTGP